MPHHSCPLFGEGQHFAHDDQTRIAVHIARIVNKVPQGIPLPPEKLKLIKDNFITKDTALLVITAIINKTSSVTPHLTHNNVDSAMVIISWSAHTEPSKLLGPIIGASAPATLTAKLWCGAMMCLGSHYVRVKAELKAAKVAKLQKQTSIHDSFKPKTIPPSAFTTAPLPPQRHPSRRQRHLIMIKTK